MSSLVLNLKKEYFLAIKSGEKKAEFRLVNDYWKKRLLGKKFDDLIIRLGYPKAGNTDREMVFPYCGFTIERITHEHFGSSEVEVFAIKLERKRKVISGFRGRQLRKNCGWPV